MNICASHLAPSDSYGSIPATRSRSRAAHNPASCPQLRTQVGAHHLGFLAGMIDLGVRPVFNDAYRPHDVAQAPRAWLDCPDGTPW